MMFGISVLTAHEMSTDRLILRNTSEKESSFKSVISTGDSSHVTDVDQARILARRESSDRYRRYTGPEEFLMECNAKMVHQSRMRTCHFDLIWRAHEVADRNSRAQFKAQFTSAAVEALFKAQFTSTAVEALFEGSPIFSGDCSGLGLLSN